MAENQTISLDDMDDLLDRNLDDIADLPEYKTFHPGAHKCTIHWEVKVLDKNVDGVKKPVKHMSLELTLVETLEHADKAHDETPGKPGDKCSTLFDLTNENAMGALKKATKSLGAHMNESSLKEILKGSEGFEVIAVTKDRGNKDDKTVRYLQVEDMVAV